jgi:outer membrane protein TolC
MKDLSALKKLLILCSLLGSSVLFADELSDILSTNKKLLLDYELQSTEAQGDILENSWINPITLQYTKNYSEQFEGKTIKTGSFSVGIDQPIFRSGGIYYAIKYAQTQRDGNKAALALKKRETIGQAVKLLFEIRKVKLQQEKQTLLIKNDDIAIRQKRESFESGSMDSSFLDQAILKHSLDVTRHLELETSLMGLEQSFKLLSDKNPYEFKLPKLELITEEDYKGSNLELARDKLRAKEKAYSAKISWAKYLPTVSVQGRYTDEDPNPLFARQGIEEKYYAYGFRVSMPLDVNMLSEIEVSKVAHLKAQAEVEERKNTIDAEYKFIRSKMKIIEQKEQLAIKDEKLYKRLYKTTKNLEKAGEKTSFDTAMMHHSLQVRKLDQKIYYLDKQIELIRLYTKVANAN